jgi:hypothetical protein
MRRVRIEYRYLFLFRRKIEIEVAEKWEDLSERQFAVCTRLLTEHVPDERFISEFFGISRRLVRKFSGFERYRLIECAGFISEPKAVVNGFFLKSVPGTSLHAPEPRLKNVSFEQFMLFDTLFFDYVNSHKDSDLCKFIACLYLKKGEQVSDFDFGSRVGYVGRKVDKATMYAIFMNYIFIRKWLSKAFGYLFEYRERNPEEDKKKTGAKNKDSANRPDWNSIFDSFIGDDILHEEDYKKMRCIRAFKTINNRIKKYRDGKSKPSR